MRTVNDKIEPVQEKISEAIDVMENLLWNEVYDVGDQSSRAFVWDQQHHPQFHEDIRLQIQEQMQ